MLNNKNKNNNKMGFTLIELLVVVLIIGILAAIALPMFKTAVIRSKYTTIKNMTRSLRDASERFYLIHNEYPSSYDDLDITVEGADIDSSSSIFSISIPTGGFCTVSGGMFACYVTTMGHMIGYYHFLSHI